MANEGQYDSQTNIEIEDYEKEILAEREFAKIYNVVAGVSSVNGYTGDVILTTSDLENTSDYQTGTEVQSAIDTAISGKQDVLTAGDNISISGNTISAVDTTYTAGTGLDLSGTTFSADTTVLATKAELATVATSGNYNDLVDKPTIPDVSNFITKDVNNLTYYTTSTDMQTAINSAVGAETQNRELADTNLQNQIDAITVSSDVIDVLGTYQDLLNYDTSHVKANDIIKVLQDSTHNNAMSYYRWVITSNVGAWVYVGSEGPYYTKSETETLLNAKQNEITSSNMLASDLVDDTNQTNKFVTTAEKTTWNTEIENLQEEDELLKRNLQTTTGSGEEVTLEKTAELDFVKPPLPRGNTKQNTTTGKNLLNTSDANTTTVNGVTSYRNNGFYYLSGTNTKTDATWILPNTQNTNLPTFEIGQTYTISVKGTLPNGIYAQLNAIKTSTGTQYNLGSIRNTAPSATFTIDSDYSRTAQLFVGVQPTATDVDCNFTIQIEEGSTATSYEPYTGGIPSPNPDYPQEVEVVTGNVEVTISNENNTESKTLPVSLGNIELCKIGNYQDYLYKNNGKWYKYNAINKLVLNGSENWTTLESIASWFYWYGITDGFVDNTISGYALSNYFTQKAYNTVTSLSNGEFAYGQVSGSTRKRIVIKDTDYTTVADFKSWLSTHNTIVYYVLATPTDTEITDTTLISQLEAINNALSYEEQTNISGSSDESNPIFDVEAYQSTKLILEDLDLTKLSTFDSTKTQILKNINGSLIWVDE